MNISRKDFLKKSLMSLGEAIFTVKDALKSSDDAPLNIPDAGDFTAVPQEERVAAANNDTCLAKNSGCFACMERCEAGAIKLVPGAGVSINQALCNGCGSCEYVCPVTPKAIRMQARTTTQTVSADHAGQHSQKGE